VPGEYSTATLQAHFEQINKRLAALEEAVTVVAKTVGVHIALALPEDVPAEVIELARGGDQLGAIKRYRELTGASLDQARDVVVGI
jgi:ribosomal protein L7/L12